ncbi:hypothetical protein [Ruegeria arenilitoris]|nr:hypothetical protein [Ruegeria arenilitoris]
MIAHLVLIKLRGSNANLQLLGLSRMKATPTGEEIGSVNPA